MTAVGLIAALCLGTSVSQTVEDDFETGTLLLTDMPPGPWNAVVIDGGAGTAVAVSAAAAHRGSRGLRIDVGNPIAASDMGFVEFNPFPTVSTGSYYLREWVRVSPAGGAMFGTEGFAQVSAVNFQMAAVNFGGVTPLNSGTWYLVESELLALGTNAGATITYVNGVPSVPTRINIPWGLESIASVAVGLNGVLDGGFFGAIDLDDVRSSLTFPASTFAFSPDSGTLATATCTPLTLNVLASDGSAAGMPYDAGVSLVVQGVNGQFFNGMTCFAAITTVELVEGQSSAPIAFRALTPGTATLLATHPDFLSGPASFTVQGMAGDAGVGMPDAGVPDAGAPDAGVDAGTPGDAGAGVPDSGAPDGGGNLDGGSDAGTSVADGGAPDTGASDSGIVDSGFAPDGGPGAPGRYAVGCGCASGETAAVWAFLLLAVASSFLKRRQRGGNA